MTLIDTNILVYAHNADSPQSQRASELIKSALNQEFESCIAHQNLLEFFSVITSPKRVSNPLTPQEALLWIETYFNSISIRKIFPSQDTMLNTINEGKKLKLSKMEIFDCYLAMTMQENNVSTIYTDNTLHFKKYQDIKVINPLITIS